jgi:hypothetical protein
MPMSGFGQPARRVTGFDPGSLGGRLVGGPDPRVLGSYKKGTDYVPKTGLYKLHEGEAVKTKEENMEHTPEEKQHFARAMHKLHGGALHRHFGIPEDETIPESKKEEAAHSDNSHVAAMGRLALAMSHWKRDGHKA